MTDSEGQAKGNVIVTATPEKEVQNQSGNQLVDLYNAETGISDDKGNWSLKNIKPGRYKIWAANIQDGDDEYYTQNGFIVEDKDLTLDIRLKKGVSLAGRFIISDGTPLPDANLILLSQGNDPLGFANGESGDDGAYSLEKAVPPGKYRIIAFHDDYAPEFIDIELLKDEKKDIVLVPGASIKVRLESKNPEKISKRKISICDKSGNKLFKL